MQPGEISKEALIFILKNLNDFSDEELETLFKEIDKNGDGTIQIDEWCDWISAFAEEDEVQAGDAPAPAAADKDDTVDIPDDAETNAAATKLQAITRGTVACSSVT